ncbi:hypothetical protein [Streptomyces sp. NPDC089919]|uniref:hypothetical protein n=1 Tax=Streptomyces sp. NPDC089919 TaxID=3155188 RepID=UPI00343FA506
MTELFASDRMFKLWAYTVSHRRLLLRSTSEGGVAESRIDVCFGGVARMSVEPFYDGLTVTEVPQDEWAAYSGRIGEVPSGFRLYALGAGQQGGLVIAGVVQWHEDTRGFDDPSYFGHFPGA